MIFELIEDVAKLVLIVAVLYFAIGAYVRRNQSAWPEALEKRRLFIVSVLILAVSAIKVSEDALSGDSGPIDKAILLFIHGHVAGRLIGFFEALKIGRASC